MFIIQNETVKEKSFNAARKNQAFSNKMLHCHSANWIAMMQRWKQHDRDSPCAEQPTIPPPPTYWALRVEVCTDLSVWIPNDLKNFGRDFSQLLNICDSKKLDSYWYPKFGEGINFYLHYFV